MDRKEQTLYPSARPMECTLGNTVSITLRGRACGLVKCTTNPKCQGNGINSNFDRIDQLC